MPFSQVKERSPKVIKELASIYTDPEEARREIWRRWENVTVREKMENALGGAQVFSSDKTPVAVLARHVLSPNFELFLFLEKAAELALSPLVLEYLEDKFVAENMDKYFLGKLCFYEGRGKKGGDKISSQKIIHFNQEEGKKINEVKTMWNKNFVDFHHRWSQQVNLPQEVNHHDLTQFYKKNGLVAANYYINFFSLFITHAVLVENYLLTESHYEFTRDIVLPAFKKAEELFGLRPLIVKLGPVGREEDLYWRYYPVSSQKSALQIMQER